MQQCAEHVEYQLPNQHTHMGYLLDSIQCPDPGLQAAIASIHIDNRLQGMCNNFETTATHQLRYDPVIKKQAASTRCPAAQILALEGDNAVIVDRIGKKPSIGKSGVNLCYHMNLEYHELTAKQKRELSERRESNSNFRSSKPGKNTKGKLKGVPITNFQTRHRAPPLFLRRSRRLWLKQDEPEEGVDVEPYITGMVQATVAKMQTNLPELASDSKSTKKVTLIYSQTGKEHLCLMGSSSMLTLQVKEGEHAAARQRMGSWQNNEHL